jgi:hypothetical protein
VHGCRVDEKEPGSFRDFSEDDLVGPFVITILKIIPSYFARGGFGRGDIGSS